MESAAPLIFGLFEKKRGPARDPDRIWLSTVRKLAGIAGEATSAQRVLIVAHFRSTLDAVASALQSRGQSVRTYTDRVATGRLTSATTFLANDGIALALAAILPAPEKLMASSDEESLVVVAEHHFLPQEDDRILRFCGGLAFPVRLRFHEALDAPLLRLFSDTQLPKLLAQLGLAEDEAIEHAMVGRAIRNAQEKIAERSEGGHAASSPEEWLRLNIM